MPFALEINGGAINGGNFNSVHGNMTQVFNSQVVRVNAPVDQVEGSHRVRHSGINDPPRAIRGSRRDSNSRPYDIANRRNLYGPEISHTPSGNISNDLPMGAPASHQRTRPVWLGDGSMYIADSNRGRFQLPILSPHFSSEPPLPHNSSNTFNSVGGDMTQLNLTSHGESGIDVLSRDVVGEALHDSCERFPEPACHPGTRTAILEQLSAWSMDASTEGTVMWVNGPAGVGKSAIAQMFAGNCQAQGHLGASFFFKRGDSKRGTWHGLFPTIAYQLSTSIPGLSLPIQQAVETDKLVACRAMPVQFERLILEPFRQADPLGILTVIVLDGLDECEDHTIQQQVLRLFLDTLRGTPLPIRMLICSRPDPHLREVLETAQTSAICRHLALSCDKSAYEDIRTYLRDEFSRIHSEYRTRGIDLRAPWPSAEELEYLVRKSSGIFIYATTVIRFVGDEYSHPVDRLDSVLALDPQSTAPLDDLYKQILSLVPHSWQHLQILHVIWTGRSGSYFRVLGANPEELDTLLMLRSGTTRLMLRGLHPLVQVPPISSPFAPHDGVEILHASFSDHLDDPRRSGPWCVSLPGLRDDLLHCIVRFLCSPPVIYNTQEFCRGLVITLSGLLKDATPSETLFELMRNETFQESLFLSCKLLEWPQLKPCSAHVSKRWSRSQTTAH
ncbi:hypothetical protein C8R45DRAFT_992821 [Mycena sanguinolenta]|nr:hypothetical protein C8R45DRAFT_992821 [Mycena sanguinolenta]